MVNNMKRTYTSQLNLLNTKMRNTAYDVGNPGPGLEQAQKCGGVYLITEFWGFFMDRKSKNSKLRQRRGEIEIISPFCVSTFSGFRLSLIRVFFFASSQAGRRRWTLQSGCRHRCGFDPHVCQGFKAPSLAQGFADFPDLNIGLPPQDWWPFNRLDVALKVPKFKRSH